MHLTFRNANDAFRGLVKVFAGSAEDVAGTYGVPVVRRPSRNGDVLMIDEPVTVTYTHPRERVLFNAARDANPFFHLYEALWMLAGRNDVASVAYYASRMKEFSDDSVTLNGAYGYRWRKAGPKSRASVPVYEQEDGNGPPTIYDRRVNQLDVLVDHLKADPTSRRAVLQMWNVEDDLLKIGLKQTSELHDKNNPAYRGTMETVTGASRDVCCNLSVIFSLRETDKLENEGVRRGKEWAIPVNVAKVRTLNMTVISRSEDFIWGLLGADYVDFSILQEYLAARLGADVGRYHHFSNNLHAYSWNWKPEEWLATEQVGGKFIRNQYDSMNSFGVSFVPLVKDPAAFERELPLFVEDHSGPNWHPGYKLKLSRDQITEPFLRDVAYPMFMAHHWFRKIRAGATDQGDVQDALSNIAADDWRLAATNWMARRGFDVGEFDGSTGEWDDSAVAPGDRSGS